MIKKENGLVSQKSVAEKDNKQALRSEMSNLLGQLDSSWEYQLSLFQTRQALARQIYYAELYRQIIDVPGVICEFGVHWGASLALLGNLRALYEPYNHSRRIYGFDTFQGFGQVDEKDGGLCQPGDYAVAEAHAARLATLLRLHEDNAPLSHIPKNHLVIGDVSTTLPGWLEENPHAVIAMAIFDMDVYRPTRDALQAIVPRLTRGSLLVFDELNCPAFPGETLALDEVIGLGKLRLRRHPLQPYCAWAVYGE